MECYVYLYCVYVYRCVDSTLFIDSFWLFLPYFESLPIQFSLAARRSRGKEPREECALMGWNGRIRFAVVFNDGCRNEKIAEHIPFVLFFVCWRVIISRRTKIHYYDINSALVPLSLRPFYQILVFVRKSRKS